MKTVAFKGKYPVNSKIVIYNKLLDQVSHFNFMGCDVEFDRWLDIKLKLNKFKHVWHTGYL